MAASLVAMQRQRQDRYSLVLWMIVIITGLAYLNLLREVTRTFSKVFKTETVQLQKVRIAPPSLPLNLHQTPRKGDRVPNTPWVVTSPWGPRKIDIPGASTFHKGVDVNASIGTPLYAIGKAGKTVTVKCWYDRNGGGQVASYSVPGFGSFDYLHLSQCSPGKHRSGSIIARSGDSGIGLAHFHLTQRTQAGIKVPPTLNYLVWSLTGKQPKPQPKTHPKTLSQGPK